LNFRTAETRELDAAAKCKGACEIKVSDSVGCIKREMIAQVVAFLPSSNIRKKHDLLKGILQSVFFGGKSEMSINDWLKLQYAPLYSS
jgi:hypothetical protein